MVTSLEDLKWVTPPCCHGQLVTASYAWAVDVAGVEDGPVMRLHDACDRSVAYYGADDETREMWLENPDSWQPWNCEPGGTFDIELEVFQTASSFCS